MVDCIGEFYELKCKVSAVIFKPLAKPRDRERLARCSATEQVRSLYFAGQYSARYRSHVAKVGHIRIVVRKYRRREGLYLGKPCRLPPKGFKGYRGSFNA